MSTWRPLTTPVTSQAEPGTDSAKPPSAQMSAARPWMAGRVDLAEPVDGDQRVDLRGRHRRVPEQFLDDADVRPAVEQVRGERVPQGVRRDLGSDPRALGGRAQDGPGTLPRQRSA